MNKIGDWRREKAMLGIVVRETLYSGFENDSNKFYIISL